MSIAMMIYLADVLTNFVPVLTILSGFTLIVLFVMKLSVVCGVTEEESYKKFHPKTLFVSAIISMFVALAIPSKNAIYMMAGASIAKDIAENPKVVDTMDKVYKLVNKELDDRLNKKEK